MSVEGRALNCWQLWAKVEAPNIMLNRLNWEHLNAWFYLCLKKQVASQLPDVGELQRVAREHGPAMLSQVTTCQRETTCFPKTLGREPSGFHVSLSLKKLNLGTPKRMSLHPEKIDAGTCQQRKKF